MAAAHWLAALVFGLALTALLEAAIDMPRPPTAPAGFGFPSVAVTMTTITFGFFAVLIARELPGRRRVWPYLLAGVVTTRGRLRAAVPGRALAERPGRRHPVRLPLAAGAGPRLPPPRGAFVLDAAAGVVCSTACSPSPRCGMRRARPIRCWPSSPCRAADAHARGRRLVAARLGDAARPSRRSRRAPALAAGRAGGRPAGTAAGRAASRRAGACSRRPTGWRPSACSTTTPRCASRPCCRPRSTRRPNRC